MKRDVGTVERAFELAKTGSYPNVSAIEAALTREGFTTPGAHLSGPSLRKQLAQISRESK